MPLHPNAALLRTFYESFAKRDFRGMASCYDPAITFSDEVFIDLEGPRAGAMWQMLCERADDLKIEFRDIEADDATPLATAAGVIHILV